MAKPAIGEYKIRIVDETTKTVLSNLRKGKGDDVQPKITVGQNVTSATIKNVTAAEAKILDAEKKRGTEVEKQQKLSKSALKDQRHTTSQMVKENKVFLKNFMRDNANLISPKFRKANPSLIPRTGADVENYTKEYVRILGKKTKEQQKVDEKKEASKSASKAERNAEREKRRAERETYRRTVLRARNMEMRERQIEKMRSLSHKKYTQGLSARSKQLRGLSTMSLSLNMSMLGIMFSFMSFFSMVSGMFGTLMTAASNITGAVTGGAMAQAFLPGLDREGGMDVTTLIEGYKTSLGLQGEMSYQMSLFASTLLTNTDIVNGIMTAVKSFADKMSDPVFFDKLVKAAISLIDTVPKMMNSLDLLVDLVSMFMPLIQTFLPLILSSIILLPVLSLLNAVIGTLLMAASLIVDAILLSSMKAEATRVATMAAQAAGTATAGVAGGAAGGVAGGLLSGITWASITSGLAGALSGALTAASVVTGLAALAGLIIGTVVVAAMDALGILDWVGSLGKAFGEWMRGSDFGQYLLNVMTLILTPVTLIGAIVVGFVEDGIDGVIARVKQTMDIAGEAFNDVLVAIVNNVIGPVIGLIDSVLNAGGNTLAFLSDFSLSDAFSSLLGHATGGYIANTGMALVHEGEYISNASETSSGRSSVNQQVNITVYGDLDSSAADRVINELVNQQRYSSWS